MEPVSLKSIIPASFVLLAGLLAAPPGLAQSDLTLPIIERRKIVIGENEFSVGLYSATDKSLTNFVYIVQRNGYFLRVGLLEGAAPAIVLFDDFKLPRNLVGIQFIQGGHQRTLIYLSFLPDDVRELGSIGSDAACIFQRPGKDGVVESMDSYGGKITLTTYTVSPHKIRKIRATKVPFSQFDLVSELCEKYNLLEKKQ